MFVELLFRDSILDDSVKLNKLSLESGSTIYVLEKNETHKADSIVMTEKSAASPVRETKKL